MPLIWDIASANALPMLYKDPMDRMLIASTLGRDMTIVTNDRIIDSYGVRTIW